MQNEKFIDVDSIRTRYFEAGSGPNLCYFTAAISAPTTRRTAPKMES